MAVILDYALMDGALSMRDVIDLLEIALKHEAAGKTDVSPKYITEFAGGAMRMLVAADHAAGYLATKVYHSVKGAGARYVVTLYNLKDGALLAWLDGQLITDLRTGGASGVIARQVPIDGEVSVGIIGSGDVRDLSKKNVERGMVLAAPGSTKLFNKIKANVYVWEVSCCKAAVYCSSNEFICCLRNAYLVIRSCNWKTICIVLFWVHDIETIATSFTHIDYKICNVTV